MVTSQYIQPAQAAQVVQPAQVAQVAQPAQVTQVAQPAQVALTPQPPQAPERERRFRILVLGSTGSGKSTFIQQVTKEPVAASAGVNSCTKVCRPYPVKYPFGQHVSMWFDLVDTPGFGDSDGVKRDIDILREIMEYVDGAWGIVYMHRIEEPRLNGASRLNLDTLKAMCGKDFYNRVAICTTMWNNFDRSDKPEACERELLRGPFADLRAAGASYFRFYVPDAGKPADSCYDLLEHFASIYPRMSILKHLKNVGGNLYATRAGRLLEEQAGRPLEEQAVQERARKNKSQTSIMERLGRG